MGRISKERMEKALERLKTISEDDYAKVKALAAIVKRSGLVRAGQRRRPAR